MLHSHRLAEVGSQAVGVPDHTVAEVDNQVGHNPVEVVHIDPVVVGREVADRVVVEH